MRLVALLLAGIAFTVGLPVMATPQARDLTDMWFDPAESGWGLNLIHQGDTLFGTLFVYGPDGQPKWYVASNLTGDGTTFAGGLTECAGPGFGGAFNASAVACRDVGTMRIVAADRTASLDYTVNGVHVTKAVQRFTFRRTTLRGAYEAYMVQPGTSGPPNKTDLTIQVGDDGSSFTMYSSSDSQSSCDWTATPSQDGQVETVSGKFGCGSAQNPFKTGSWSMSVDPTTEGFTGTFVGDGITSGRIAAARAEGDLRMQGYGWRNDMWFVPSESGWGLNVIEQGDILFATLFVYDSQRRPRWYVASGLEQQGDSSDGRVTYSGALVESTGPYFAQSFNPGAVTRREVGRMSFQANPDGTGSLTYSVDGVQVSKQVQRFAFRKQSLTGSYLGSVGHDRQADITIDDEGSEFRMRVSIMYAGIGTCEVVAPYAQLGSLRTMNGTITCTSGGTPSGGFSGPFTMQHATVSAHGFTARFDAPRLDYGPRLNAHIAGVRR